MRLVTAFVRLLPSLIGALVRVTADPSLPRRVKLAVAAALVYLVSPFDVMPDLIPFVGYVDDVLLSALVVDGILSSVDRGVVLRYWPASPAALNAVARVARLLSAWVPRRVRRRVFALHR